MFPHVKMLSHKCRLILQSAHVEISLTIWIEWKNCWSPAPREPVEKQWCAEAKQVSHTGDEQHFVEVLCGLNYHMPATIWYPHWTLRRMQPLKWEWNPRALCGSSFSSNFRIGALSWNLYSDTHTRMQNWIKLQMYFLTTCPSHEQGPQAGFE